MREKNRISIYILVYAGIILSLSNSCTKDENSPKKEIVIIWENPADITYGTLLSATQLNASANVLGTFVYTPAIGASLNVGTNQELKVDFTPTDVATYNQASKTVKINVTQAPYEGGVSTAVFNTAKTYGIMTDQNGNTYKTITIGNQTWMAENLRVTKYRNGDPIPHVTVNEDWLNLKTGAFCTYQNTTNKDDVATYGAIYNWYAVSDSRNIAPTGWHVATDKEWTQLTDFLGGENLGGGKLKESGSTHFTSPNISATNESGFTALPGGLRLNLGGFTYRGISGYWWCSDKYDTTNAWARAVYGSNVGVNRDDTSKQDGFSVRCVKD